MAGITHKWNGTVLTITSDSGTTSCDLRGEKGDVGIRGPQGIPGEPGRVADVDLSDYSTKTETAIAIQEVQTGLIMAQNEMTFHTLATNPHRTTAADIGALTAKDIENYATKQYVIDAIVNSGGSGSGGGSGGGITATDDGNGNITLTSIGGMVATVDGNGNIVLGG